MYSRVLGLSDVDTITSAEIESSDCDPLTICEEDVVIVYVRPLIKSHAKLKLKF
jgi:hypothetical protein